MPIPASSPAQFLPTTPETRPDGNPSEPIDRVPVSNAGLAHVWVRARDTVPTRVLEVAEDDTAWRRAGSPLQAETPREPSPSITRQLLLDAYEAYCTNPLAYAVIEQGTNFVLGGGVRATAADARVQRAIDRFWHDPENRLDLRVYAIQTELSLFGEQFLRAFTDPATGRVVIRQLDPLAIEAIETDPDDIERPRRYLYRPPNERSVYSSGGAGSEARGDGANTLDGEWIPAAEVDHFAINRVSNARRGRSDLAPILPWLIRYKEWLLDRVRINRSKGAFLYDVTVTGGRRDDLERLRREYEAYPPEPGSILFHNEVESWRAVQPNIGADDVRDDGRALRLMIATGAGVPEHYLSEGGNANRATASEMGLPAIKRFQRRQEYLRGLLTRVVRRALDAQVAAGRLSARADRRFTVTFDELVADSRDVRVAWLSQATDALATATDRGWVSGTEARRLWWRLAGDADAVDGGDGARTDGGGR